MDQYTVTGMSCAACQARVEKAVSKVEGVSSCNVSLLTNTLAVEGTASPEAVMQAGECGLRRGAHGCRKRGRRRSAGAGSRGAQEVFRETGGGRMR